MKGRSGDKANRKGVICDQWPDIFMHPLSRLHPSQVSTESRDGGGKPEVMIIDSLFRSRSRSVDWYGMHDVAGKAQVGCIAVKQLRPCVGHGSLLVGTGRSVLIGGGVSLNQQRLNRLDMKNQNSGHI